VYPVAERLTLTLRLYKFLGHEEMELELDVEDDTSRECAHVADPINTVF
jgi:hypothetical protein